MGNWKGYPKIPCIALRKALRPAIVLIAVFVASPSRTEIISHTGFDGLGSTYGVAQEFGHLVTMLGDDVLRELVCRVAFERYTPQSLGRALNLSREQIMPRINELRSWGLVRLIPGASGHMIVEPIPGIGERTLHRWGLKYCADGDACGRTVANPGPQKDRPEKNTADRKDAGIYPTFVGEEGDSLRFSAAIKQIDVINITDPRKIFDAGLEYPRELLLSARRSAWLDYLSPHSSDPVRIAVRALRIDAWTILRENYSLNPDGYHKWREALGKHHSKKITEILVEAGYGDEEIAETTDLITEYYWRTDGDGQDVRDVYDIVFFEYEFEELVANQPDEKVITFVRSTWKQMSQRSRDEVRRLDLSPRAEKLIDIALSSEGEVEY